MRVIPKRVSTFQKDLHFMADVSIDDIFVNNDSGHDMIIQRIDWKKRKVYVLHINGIFERACSLTFTVFRKDYTKKIQGESK